MKKFTDSFTALRGLCCMCVCAWHEAFLRSGGPFNSLQRSGEFVVPFFFVLSAYLLVKNILNEMAPKKDECPKRFIGMTGVKYFIRRVFRVYPPFIAVLAIDYGVWKYYNYQDGPSFFDMPVETFFWDPRVGNHFWTLRIELLFYFFGLPAIAIVASELMRLDYKCFRRFYIRTFYIAVIWFTYYIVNIHKTLQPRYALWDDKYNNKALSVVFWYGALGGILAHITKDYELKLNNWFKKLLGEIALYATLIRIAYGNFIIKDTYAPIFNPGWSCNLYDVCPYFALILLLLDKTGLQCSLGRFLNTPMLVSIGTWSYSTYLIHWACLQVLRRKMDMQPFDGCVQLMFLANFAGFVVYSLVESPFFKLSKPVIRLVEWFVAKMEKYVKLIFSLLLRFMPAMPWRKHKTMLEDSKEQEEVELATQ